MIIKTFKVTVEVEPNILADKYPNFHSNYENVEEFMNVWAKRVEGDGLDKLSLGANGYRIKVSED